MKEESLERDLTPVRGVLLRRGIVYGRAGSRRLRLDVALPATGDGPFPLLLVFPGNGWGYFFWFDRRACRREILEAASRGYVAAAIDYRAAIGAGFEGGLKDARSALEWLRAHADELHANPQRVALTGFSSGGQLALLLGQDPAADRASVRAIVSTSAPVDLSAFAARPLLGLALRGVLGRRRVHLDRYRRASPAANVREGMPPVLVLHGMSDHFVPVEQSFILDRALRRARVFHELVLAAAWGHRDRWQDPEVWDFLSRNLSMSGRPSPALS